VAEFALKQKSEAPARERSQPVEAKRPQTISSIPANQTLQALYGSGAIRAKLRIGAPDDPEEKQADHLAHEAISGKTAACACSPGPPCPKCRAAAGATLRRKPRTGDVAHRDVADVVLGSERRLGESDRAFFESRYQADLSRVRIHDNPRAAESAAQINARAFSLGSSIAFGAGEYRPATPEGKQLLAHELAHVVLGHSEPAIRRETVDPSNIQTWKGVGGRQSLGDIQNKLVSAAPEAAAQMEKKIKETGAPKTDAEHEALERRLQTLIRLNALSMMAAHKAGIEHRRDVTLGTERSDDQKSAVQSQHESAENIRNAIAQVRKLNHTREELTGYRDDLDYVRTDSIHSWTFPVMSWFKTISDSSWRYITPEQRNYLRLASASVGQIQDPKLMRLLVHNVAEHQVAWREKQIRGIDASIQALYKAYPLLTQWEDFLSMPDIVVLSHDDNDVMKLVAAAYKTLLAKVDGAIARIGKGDPDAFDLPEPTQQTRQSLSPELQKELDEILKKREVNKFRNELITAGAGLALLFIPVIGPVLAAAVGVASLAMDLDDMIDRAAIGGAADNPEHVMLGVSAPKDYEWAMLAVQATLTAFDLGSLAKEMKLGAAAEHAAAEAHPGGTKPKGTTAEPHGGTSGTGSLADEGRVAHPPVDPSLDPALAREQEFLKGTKSKPALAGDEAERELEIAQSKGTRRTPTKPDTAEEIVTPGDHGHVWRKSKKSGLWCRSSPGEVCYITAGNRDKSLAPEGYKLTKAEGGVPDLEPGTVVEFEGGQRSWRMQGQPDIVVEESTLAPGVQRQGFEKGLPSRGQMGGALAKSDSQLAHGLGAGTGFEGPYGIRRAPAEVNQALENTGIELYLREAERLKPEGLTYHYVVSSEAHPNSISLKSRTYRVDATMNGRRRSLFTVKIEVSAGPKPTGRITEVWINPDPDVIQVLPSPNDLPTTIPERLRFIFSKGASFPAEPLPGTVK
jgi:hypothetical protein